MITVHHLDDSRSQRILWLLEELELPYELVQHRRDPATRFAPPELKAVHPLGKAPVIVDDGQVIAESGAIVEHLIREYGSGGWRPAPGSPDEDAYLHWLHFAEGSAILPFMLQLYLSRLGDAAAPLMPRVHGEIAATLGYLEGALAGREWLVGDGPTGADVMAGFVGEIAVKRADTSRLPALVAWVERIHARPAYARALERGGPYAFA